MRSILALVFCFLAIPAEARPKRHIADWRFWTSTAIKVGISGFASYTINRCRHDHGIGPCWGGDYGPFPAKETIRNSVSIGTVPLTYLLKKQEDESPSEHKVWWLFDIAQDTFNGGTIIRNAHHSFKAKGID